MLVTAVRLALLLTGCAARHLLQDGPKLVGTAEELEAAIRDAETDILFTQNVTLSQSNFPEVPRICLADAPTISSVRDCSEEAVVYSNTQPSASGNMTWSSVPSAFLDARYMQRAIVLGSQLVLRDMQIAQMTDDRSPRFVLFELIESGSLIIQNSVLYSPCGGRGPQHYITSLLTIFPVSSAYEISAERNEVLFFDSQAYTPTPTTSIRLFNTTVRCYNPLESPFAPEVVPEDWLPTSDVTTLRPNDECQRRETLGTDYRGTIGRTVNGYRCQYWNTTYPQDHTFGPARLPAWGLGSQETSHNFCRNPDSHQDGVWCYIEDDAAPDQFQRRQPCDVPWCEGGVVADLTLGSRTEGSEPEVKRNDISTGVLIAIIAAGMVAIVFLGLLVCYVYRRQPCGWCIPVHDDSAFKRNGSRDSESRVPVGGMAGGAGKGSTGAFAPAPHSAGPPGSGAAQYTVVAGTLADLIRERLNQRRQDDAPVQLMEEIGRGPHSVVYRGLWNGVRVAIKSLLFTPDSADFGSPACESDLAALREFGEAAVNLSHSSLTTMYICDVHAAQGGPDAFEDGSAADGGSQGWRLLLVQEYMNGGTLGEAVAAGFFQVAGSHAPHMSHILQVVYAVSMGLHHLHSKDMLHGDLNPNNVLLQTKRPAQRSALRTVAEEGEDTAPRYGELAAGFAAKLTDIAPTLKMGAQRPSTLVEGRSFHIAPETQYQRIQTKASDVYVLGVLLWELYHSRPCCIPTRTTFYILNPTFPKFPDSCPLAYAALANACVLSDPKKRPSMVEVVEVITHMLVSDPNMLPDSEQGSTRPPLARNPDGTVALSPFARSYLGVTGALFAEDEAWHGALSELNHVELPTIQRLLRNMRLTDVYNVQRALPAGGPSYAHALHGTPEVPRPSSGPQAGWANAHGDAAAMYASRGPSSVPAATGASRLAPWEDILSVTAANDAPGVLRRGAGAGGDSCGAQHEAVAEHMNATIDEQPKEMGSDGDATSDEESQDNFHEVINELSGILGNGAHGNEGYSAHGPGHAHATPNGRRGTDGATATAPTSAEAGTATPPLSGMRGSVPGSWAGGYGAPVSGTPPGTADLVSSRSNASIFSDNWDAFEGRLVQNKNPTTGKDIFTITRVHGGRGRGGFPGAPAPGARRSGGVRSDAARAPTEPPTEPPTPASLSTGWQGGPPPEQTLARLLMADTGHEVSSDSMAPGRSADSEGGLDGVLLPGTDWQPTAALGNMPMSDPNPGRAAAGPVAQAASPVATTGGAAAAAAHTTPSARAALAALPGPSSDPPALGSGGRGPAEGEDLRAARARSAAVRGHKPLPGPQADFTELDDESERDILRWGPAERASRPTSSQLRSSLDIQPVPPLVAQSQAARPTSNGSTSSAASGPVAAAAPQLVRPQIGVRPGNVRGLHSIDSRAPDASRLISADGVWVPVGVGRGGSEGPRSLEPLVARTPGDGASGAPPMGPHSGENSATLHDANAFGDASGGVNVPPLLAGRAAAHLAGLRSAETALQRRAAAGAGAAEGPAPTASPPNSSFDGSMRLTNRPGIFRPMVMRSDRTRVSASDLAPSGPTSQRNSSARASMVASAPGEAARAVTMKNLFDSLNASDTETSPRGGTQEAARKAWGAGGEEGMAAARAATRGAARGASTIDSMAVAAQRRPQRERVNDASDQRLDGAADLAAAFGLGNAGASSQSGDSPLSVKNLIVSHVGSSIDTHPTPQPGSLDTGSGLPSELANPPSTGGASGPAGAVATGGAGTAGPSPDAVGIDLNPKQRKPGTQYARQRGRAPADIVRLQGRQGPRRGVSDGSAAPGQPKGAAKGKPVLLSKEEGGTGKSSDMTRLVHPLLRHNRAVLTHVHKLSSNRVPSAIDERAIDARNPEEGERKIPSDPTHLAAVKEEAAHPERSAPHHLSQD